MANDNTLNVEIKAVITDLEKDLKRAAKGLDKFAAKSKAIGKKMQSAGIAMSKRFTAPLAILGGVALKAAADLETLETSLSVMTGSAAEGKKLLKELTDFAAKTPFQLEGIGNTAKVLLAFGFTAVEVKGHLKSLGDVAAGSGTPLGELGRVFGQVAAAGKLTGERLLQFQERAVPIGGALAKTMGVAESSIKDMVSAGKVSFKDFEKAFKSLTLEGGIFEDAMIKQSKTLAGIFSTLKDNVNLSLGELGTNIAETFNLKEVADKLIKKIQDITKWFSELDRSTKKIIIQVAGFTAIIGPLLVALGFMMTTVIPGLVTAFGFLSGAIVTATGAMLRFTAALLANPIGAAAVIIAGATIAFTELLDSLTGLGDSWQTFMNMIKSGGDPLQFAMLQADSYAAALNRQTLAAEAATKAQKKYNGEIPSLLLAPITPPPPPKKETRGVASSIATTVPLIAPDVDGFLGNLTQRLVGGIGLLKSTLEPLTVSMNDTLAGIIPSSETEKATEMITALLAFNDAASDIINSGIANTFADLGFVIGDALASGANVLESAGAALLGSLGGILIQMGEMAITIGVGLAGIKTALKSLNPVAAIAAGGALIALGSFFSSKSKSISKSMGGGTGGGASSSGSDAVRHRLSFGKGGGASNSSFRGGSSGGASSSSGGGHFVFEIAGTKLIGVMKNTLDRNKALGGTNLVFP